MARFFFLWRAVAVVLSGCEALKIVMAPDASTYSVVDGAKTLFSSGERSMAVFAGGAWWSERDGTLRMTSYDLVDGSDAALGGAYEGVEMAWATADNATTVVTRAVAFAAAAVFTTRYPDGARATSPEKRNGESRDSVIANWPCFVRAFGAGRLSWGGSFVRASLGAATTGPTGGPVVFFDDETVAVGSALDGFKASSAGPGTTWDGAPAAWAPGTAGTVDSLPANFSQSFVVTRGGGAAGGVTRAVAEWGALLRASRGAEEPPFEDVTLAKVGYQTDNGAMYCFCSAGNCSETLIAKARELAAGGAPMGYLSFQGAGASAGRGQAAPWCVSTWGVDGGLGRQYPITVGDLAAGFGAPVQLYAPYFCPGSAYFNATSPWRSLASNTSREGCKDYAFEDVAPAESRAFYGAMFDRGVAEGMVSFEPDFMNQNSNCVDAFVETVDGAITWQRGMADAALERNVSVQWCYATPADVLASLDMPAVTNFRVSFDFCYGNSWDVGASGLLVWALGKHPSKDTLWTTANDRTATPGCPWTPDHEAVAAPLHVILALMSGGPVGVSDALGQTDYDLLRSAIANDGTLLKATKALTSIDAILADRPGKPDGHVLGAHAGSAALTSHALLSFKLREAYGAAAADFYPPLEANATYAVRERLGARCADGAAAASCVTFTTASAAPVATLPASDFSNVTAGTDYAPALTWLTPVCPSGYALLGDLTKIVPLSPVRFADLRCTETGVAMTLVGAPQEEVPLTYLLPDAAGAPAAVVKVVTFVVPKEGRLPLTL